jgi:hypothetical protein
MIVDAREHCPELSLIDKLCLLNISQLLQQNED